MPNQTSIIEKTANWYESWPEWLRWILFLPIGLIISVILTTLMGITLTIIGGTLFDGDTISDIRLFAVSSIWWAGGQAIFLGSVFSTVPRKKIEWIKGFMILRIQISILALVVYPLLCRFLDVNLTMWKYIGILVFETITWVTLLEFYGIIRKRI